MPSKVFISYRRDDTKYQARDIHDAFCRVLPRDHVFMDVATIPPGANFRQVLRGWVDQCEVLLALIGPGWLNATDPKSKGRRLDNPSDLVRIEIGEALACGIPVVPVLIDGVPMPDIDLLPDDLKELVNRQAEFVEYRNFVVDVERLIRKLGLTEGPRRQVRWNWIGAIAAVLIAAYFVAHYIGIPVWWPDAAKPRADKEAARRDPALSVKPGSGQSFRDRLADGQPCPLCPEMVVAPAGEFTMGSPRNEPGRQEGETQIPVEIPRPFAVGKFAVTFDQWDACVADAGCNKFPVTFKELDACRGCYGYRPDDQGWGGGNRPVINVNWADADAYAEWLSRKTGKTYRLLSEAEREYVTRAGTTTAYWWGSSITPKQANYNYNYTYNGGTKGEYRAQTVPVDSFEANPWGLYNVHGNVWEWTADCWNDSNISNPGNGSARATGDCTRRVVRGGSWLVNPQFLRAAARIWYSGGHMYFLGFRLARTLE
jgi:formylglycine-generating enzyme required for sulfatase activity